MSGKIPDDAFDWYVAHDSTYRSVAERYGVSKRAVVAHAKKHCWPERLEKLRKQSRERSEERLAENLEEMNTRHLRALRAIQGKALETLRSMPLASAMEAVRAIDLSIKHERIVRGEPGERTAVSVEEVVRREYDRWMTDGEHDGSSD